MLLLALGESSQRLPVRVGTHSNQGATAPKPSYCSIRTVCPLNARKLELKWQANALGSTKWDLANHPLQRGILGTTSTAIQNLGLLTLRQDTNGNAMMSNWSCQARYAEAGIQPSLGPEAEKWELGKINLTEIYISTGADKGPVGCGG